MDPKAPRESQRNLEAIWRQVEECRSTFLSPSDLQALGVEARQVGTTDDDGVLQFEPRYFEPHPEKVLQRYPIDAAANNYDIRRLKCIPTLQGALDTVRETMPASEDPLEAAQKLLEERLEKYHSWDDYAHADWIHCHIEYELGAIREGGHAHFSLDELSGIGESVSSRRGDPLMLQVRPLYWKSELFVQDHNQTAPLPHAICTISAQVDGTVEDQSLTIHEMRAIMRMIAIRARGSRRNWRTYPFLLLAFTGKQHGRITQIVVEAGQITVQYSKLWSFEVEETAPLELFIRCILSSPVGLERPHSHSMLRIDPVTGMLL